ncbi:SARP family transcriptional regulator [Lentzea sp. NBRC 105346]|nr:SARP family transcriptional regulator [Lentzea sp. NBRC 105346]
MGPLEVRSGAVRLEVGGVRNQKVLAALVLSAGRVVTLPHLVDVVWGDRPPSTSKHQIHKSIAELRMALYAGGDLIQTDTAGYRLAGGEVDLRTFENLVAEAQDKPAEQAVAKLRAALALWRGKALAGLESPALHAEADRLEERRVEVLEQCVGHELALGRHRELIPELTALVTDHPFRERFAELLMTTLYRSGRQADALAVYQETRTRLADNLGVEPGASLRAAHQAVLSQKQEPGKQPTVAPPVSTPAQLPADLRTFSGRADHLARLDAMLDQGADTVVITAIAGVAGVGKTALAVHWAHRVRDRFPDGQLYLNLRGYDEAPPTSAADALGQILRSLGVENDRVPRELDERAALYRSLLSQRRVLLVLDNAASESQVRPLLPGTAQCAVVITSRNDLRGLAALDDVHQMELDVLAPAEAEELIIRALGSARAGAEPEAVAELARLCGHLPLAIRIAVAELVRRPHDPIADVVDEIAGDRLARLAIRGDQRAAVTAAFDLSYRALPDDARVLFRRLGLLPRTDFTIEAADVLVGAPARNLITLLESASLVEAHTSGRFRVHDLVWLYARERMRDDPDHEAAWRRLLEFYLDTTDAAGRMLAPDMFRLERATGACGFASRGDALSWLDSEREAVVALVSQCAKEGPVPFAWHLTDALRPYLWLRRNAADCITTGQAALRAATAAGSLEGQGSAHSTLATGRMEQAGPQVEHWLAAREAYRAAGNLRGEIHALHNLGNVHIQFGSPARATELLGQALALVDDAPRKSLTLTSMGVADGFAGRLSAALGHFELALVYARSTGDELREVPVLGGLGDVCCQLGDVDRARVCAGRARVLAESSASRTWRLNTSRSMAMLERDTGRSSVALATASTLLAAAEETATSHYVLAALVVLGQLHLHAGRYEEAVSVLERGLALARSAEKAYYEASLLVELARVPGGEAYGPRALELSRQRGFRVLEGRALAGVAWQDSSKSAAAEALETQLATGHRLGQAEALVLLGRVDEAREIFAVYTGDGDHAPAGTLGFEGTNVCSCHRS